MEPSNGFQHPAIAASGWFVFLFHLCSKTAIGVNTCSEFDHGGRMSSRGEDFLKDWIDRNITDSDRPGSRELATILGARCKGEAASKGIGLIELEPAFVTVEMVIYEAMAGKPGD